MTVPTPIQQRIRILDARGVSWRRIAREVGVSRQTVRKYAQLEDCSPKPPVRAESRSKLDPYKPLIDKWLEADRFMPRKQRHTARRVYDRLVAEQGFDGSYPIVQRYVKRWRQEHRVPGEGYLELEWSPGVMQVDFGLAQAAVAGNRTDVHCLVVSFPHSNMRYAVALPGENAECVCEGLRVVFEHAGVAPLVMVSVRRHRRGAPGRVGRDHRGGRVPAVRRALPDRGQVLQSGRGQREGQRGERGRVPAPQRDGAVAERGVVRAVDEVHAFPVRRDRPTASLPVEGPGRRPVRASGARACSACRPIRSTRAGGRYARPISRGSSRSTRTGTSPAPPGTGGPWTSACARSTRGIRTQDGRSVARLPRAYGSDHGTVRDPACLLPALARKTRAWGESPIRGDFPDKLRLAIRKPGTPGNADARSV